jgi:nucleoside-diphosphate-sugar epimerase
VSAARATPLPGRQPRAVVVLGATTPLGRALCRALLEPARGPELLAVGREEESPLPHHPRLRYRQVDLTRERPLRELLFGEARELRAEVLVHLALHRTPEGGARVHAQNVQSLRRCLGLAERHPTLRRLVLRSHAEIYRVDGSLPTLLTEEHPLELSPRAPQWVRDRVEADLLACVRMGLSSLEIVVLRCAELLAPDSGSQLHAYLESPPCLRPLGFDPMLNVLSLPDAVDAVHRALRAFGHQGVFNIPGADTLPLGECLRRWGRHALPVPGPLLAPLYRARRLAGGPPFSYTLNAGRFHFAAIPDGTRAREVLGYRPSHPLQWPVPAAPQETPAAAAPRTPQRRSAGRRGGSSVTRRAAPSHPPPGKTHRRSP